MLSAYELSKYDSIKAKIQDKIGDFLKCKKILVDLAYRNDELSSRALVLLEKQIELEDVLGEALDIIKELNQGIYNPIQIANLSEIAAKLSIHLVNVNDLQIQAGTSIGFLGLPFTSKHWILGGLGGLVLLYLFYKLRRK